MQFDVIIHVDISHVLYWYQLCSPMKPYHDMSLHHVIICQETVLYNLIILRSHSSLQIVTTLAMVKAQWSYDQGPDEITCALIPVCHCQQPEDHWKVRNGVILKAVFVDTQGFTCSCCILYSAFSSVALSSRVVCNSLVFIRLGSSLNRIPSWNRLTCWNRTSLYGLFETGMPCA